MNSHDHLVPAWLKTNNLTNPLGLGKGNPELSWSFLPAEENLLQAEWRIRAASSTENLANGTLIWDSEWTVSSENFGHLYGGPTPKSRERVYWQVKVRDNRGEESDWSEPAWFEMTLLDWEDWNADWCGFPAGWSGHAIDFLILFKLDSLPAGARVYVSSPGWCETWMNAERLDAGTELQPSQCDFSQSVHVLTFDVSRTIRTGENRLVIRAGAGWYGTPAVRYRVECDGCPVALSSYSVPSAVYPSPVTRNSVYGGEEYDARLEHPDNWRSPGGTFPGHARSGQRIGGPAGKPRGLEEEPITIQGTRTVSSWTKCGNGHYVADFGQNFAGVCRLHVTAPAGTRIEMKFAEILNEDGSVNQENLLGDQAIDVYVAKGLPGGETYQPHFTYHGFRYVELIGLPDDPADDTLTGIILRTDCRPVGDFNCSNTILNRIWTMIRETEASNLHAVPTDCPQRTERMGWLNDMMARCETAMYIFDESNLLAKWLRDIAEGQDPKTGEIHMTAPLYWGFDTDPVCSSFIETTYLNYVFYGKRDLMRELYPNMRAWIDRMQDCCDENGMFRQECFVGDWVPPVYDGKQSNARNLSVSSGLISTALMYYATALLKKIAKILGYDSEITILDAICRRTRGAFLKKFRCGPGRLGEESQSAYAYAIFCGLFPDDENQAAADRLAEIFREHDYKHTTGNIGTKYLLEVLSTYGYAEYAYRLVASEDYPGWGFMLANGATTLWERWEKAEGFGMNSHNHPMLGCPGVWFFKYLAGIRRADTTAGFTNFILEPVFIHELSFVNASYDSRNGRVEAQWKRDSDEIVCRFSIPTNCQAVLKLPGHDNRVLTAGCHVIRVKNA